MIYNPCSKGGFVVDNRVVNKCIYCGSAVNLTDEHIVPFGLEGVTQLKKASCLCCNKITSPLEAHVLGHYLGKTRAALKMRHRHKKRKRKTHYAIDVHQGDKSSKLTLPIGEQPGILIFPVFDEPTYITDHYNPDDKGPLKIVGTSTSHIAGPTLGQFADDL